MRAGIRLTISKACCRSTRALSLLHNSNSSTLCSLHYSSERLKQTKAKRKKSKERNNEIDEEECDGFTENSDSYPNPSETSGIFEEQKDRELSEGAGIKIRRIRAKLKYNSNPVILLFPCISGTLCYIAAGSLIEALPEAALLYSAEFTRAWMSLAPATFLIVQWLRFQSCVSKKYCGFLNSQLIGRDLDQLKERTTLAMSYSTSNHTSDSERESDACKYESPCDIQMMQDEMEKRDEQSKENNASMMGDNGSREMATATVETAKINACIIALKRMDADFKPFVWQTVLGLGCLSVSSMVFCSGCPAPGIISLSMIFVSPPFLASSSRSRVKKLLTLLPIKVENGEDGSMETRYLNAMDTADRDICALQIHV